MPSFYHRGHLGIVADLSAIVAVFPVCRGLPSTTMEGYSMKVTGNTILITGGTSGIGRALAEAFHDRGNRVIITGRREDLLEQITAGRPGMTGLPLDLGDPDSMRRLQAEVQIRFPELNVLIANAGISRAEDMTVESWDASDAQAVVEINIFGVLRVTAAFLPLLKRQPDATIMATSSALAFVPRADFPAYCASKAFLHSWLQSLRHQLSGLPIEVLELSPPYVQTELTGAGQATDPRAMPVDVYLCAVMDLLKRKDHARGEVLLERAFARRWAERDGQYDVIFDAMNPAKKA
ncbi:SDR family oxidoreductase [Rhizobium leguminosarum]|uniref:SDR family oxidoreductase n=1 Tax=Rhizobium leguminosarum TaxID=384 RepID=UPI001FEED25F|nr:SDR family NAD(P)-dependent oxidoreductase [Rhizobium leguminosarum]